MTLKEIEEEYKAVFNESRNKYEQRLIEILKEYGLYDVDVREIKTGKIGRIVIMPCSYDSIRCEYKFKPYNKKGKLTMKYYNIYFFSEEAARKVLATEYERCV